MNFTPLSMAIFTAFVISASYTLSSNTLSLTSTVNGITRWLKISCNDSTISSLGRCTLETGTVSSFGGLETYRINNSYLLFCQITKLGSFLCFKREEKTCSENNETCYQINTDGTVQSPNTCILLCYDSTISSGNFGFPTTLTDVSNCQNTQETTTKASITVATTISPGHYSSDGVTHNSTTENLTDVINSSVSVPITIGVVLGCVIVVLVVVLVWAIRLLKRKTKNLLSPFRKLFTLSSEVQRDTVTETTSNNLHAPASMSQGYISVYDYMSQSGTATAYDAYMQPVSDG